MKARSTALLFLALTVNCATASPQRDDTQPAQDPWLQILNGGPKHTEGKQELAQERQDIVVQEIQEVEQIQPQLPPPSYPQPFQRPQRPQPQRPQQQQRFPTRNQQPPRRRPLRPRPGQVHRPRNPPRKGVIETITGTIGDGIADLTCSGSNFLTEAKLQDDAFIRYQLNCARDLGPCDEIGEKIKILAPEVLAGRCPRPCNECTRTQIKKVMAELSQRYPREFQEMINKRRSPPRKG